MANSNSREERGASYLPVNQLDNGGNASYFSILLNIERVMGPHVPASLYNLEYIRGIYQHVVGHEPTHVELLNEFDCVINFLDHLMLAAMEFHNLCMWGDLDVQVTALVLSQENAGPTAKSDINIEGSAIWLVTIMSLSTIQERSMSEAKFLAWLMDHMEAQTQMVNELAMCISQVPIMEHSQGTSGTVSNAEGKEYFTPSGSEGIPCSTQGAVAAANRYDLGTKAMG